MIFSYDSSCLIPLLSQSSETNTATAADFGSRIKARQKFVLVPHCLLETFSYLTGIPAPFRVPPARAIELLARLTKSAHAANSLTLELAFSVMEDVRSNGRSGGSIYDAHILHLARQAGVKEFVTWNAKDFLPYATPGLKIVTPSRHRP